MLSPSAATTCGAVTHRAWKLQKTSLTNHIRAISNNGINNCYYNWPFYSCVLSCLAFEWQWGWRWPYFDRNYSVFHMLTVLFSRLLVVIYIGKAVIFLSKQGSLGSHSNARQPFIRSFVHSFSFILSQKLQAHNCTQPRLWVKTAGNCIIIAIIIGLQTTSASLTNQTTEESDSSLSSFRSLRTLRALRPLRAISRWEGMKVNHLSPARSRWVGACNSTIFLSQRFFLDRISLEWDSRGSALTNHNGT